MLAAHKAQREELDAILVIFEVGFVLWWCFCSYM